MTMTKITPFWSFTLAHKQIMVAMTRVLTVKNFRRIQKKAYKEDGVMVELGMITHPDAIKNWIDLGVISASILVIAEQLVYEQQAYRIRLIIWCLITCFTINVGWCLQAILQPQPPSPRCKQAFQNSCGKWASKVKDGLCKFLLWKGYFVFVVMLTINATCIDV